MGLGSYVIYLRAVKDGVTPREVAHDLDMPEHFIHAIELEKHGGDNDSRSKLAEYFEANVDEFSDYSRSTHTKFMEILKKERRPQMGFLLMTGETLLGTVDGADSSIVKIVEANTGVKTILQRHAIKKWWLLKARSETGSSSGSSRPTSGGFRPNNGSRPQRPSNGGNRPFNGNGGSYNSGNGNRPPAQRRPVHN